MSLQNEVVSEKQIIVMLQENNPLAWVNLYDKYGSAMYGLIFGLTEDKPLAEEIFTKAFLELKQKQILSKIKFALCAIILRYTYSYTTAHLKKLGITPKKLNSPKEVELIHLLTTQCNSLNEAASILNITVRETKKRLHTAFLNLRMVNNIPTNAYSADGVYSERLLQK
jgi:hypothetical protein